MIDPEVDRRLKDLQAGMIFTLFDVTLAVSPATTTTVTRRGISTSSIVIPTPTNAAARTEGVPQVAVARDQVTFTHSASASARTYRCIFFTDAGG
jgi:hypothetical protein